MSSETAMVNEPSVFEYFTLGETEKTFKNNNQLPKQNLIIKKFNSKSLWRNLTPKITNYMHLFKTKR